MTQSLTMPSGKAQRAPAMSNARIIHHDDDLSTAVWRDVFVSIWHRNTTVEGVGVCERSVAEIRKDLPRGCSSISIIEPGAPMPTAKAREALSAFLRNVGDVVNQSAVVYEGAGFRAAAVRSVVTGITLMSKQPFPHKNLFHGRRGVRVAGARPPRRPRPQP